MKLKLGALLVFSQAAGIATRGTPEWSAETVGASSYKWHVDYKNYQEKICNSDLFIVPERNSRGEVEDSNGQIFMGPSFVTMSSIKMTHDAYCYSKSKYEQAIETKKNKIDKASVSTALTYDNEIRKHGIVLATACEQLKETKKINSGEYNTFFVDPKPCTPAPSNYVRPRKTQSPSSMSKPM